MTSPVSYRELMGDAAHALTGVHTLTSLPFRDPSDAEDTASAWRRLVITGIRHAALLAPRDATIAAMPRLRASRRPVRPPGDRQLHPAGQALLQAAERLGLAHDVLASHLGPDRQHRTSDAVLIESAGPSSQGHRDLSSMLLTAAVAHQTLARRTQELNPTLAGVPAPVTRILREGVALLGPAARLYDQAHAATPVDDSLGRLTTAPLLTAADTGAVPPERLAGALVRLEVAAHRQANGELAAGAATMRAVTAVAVALVLVDVGQETTGLTSHRPSALAAARRSWTRLHLAWGEVATLGAGSRGVLFDATTAMQLLHDGERCRLGSRTATGPTAVVDTPTWLSRVAASLTMVSGRLADEGPILVPSRWCEGADIPRRWAPAWPEHLDRLTELHRATTRDSAGMAGRSSWSPTHRGIAPASSAAPALARSS